MKTIRPLFLGIFLAATTALLPGCATQPRPEPLAITVLRMKGAARASMGGKSWQTVKKGDVLKEGMIVQTAPKSLVDICFGEKPPEPQIFRLSNNFIAPSTPRFKVTRIFENSALKIDQSAKENRGLWNHWSDSSFKEVIKLDLRAGAIMGTTISSSDNPKYEIGFAKGVISIPRNAAYMLGAHEMFGIVNGTASVFLTNKKITVEVASGREYDLVSGLISDMSSEEIHALSNLLAPRWGPQRQFATQFVSLGHGPGMGGSLRKF